MLRTESTISDKRDAQSDVWELAESMRVCMMTTWDGVKQQSRPMTPHVFRDRHAIYFLDKADSDKEHQVKKFPQISLIFMDPHGNKYLTLSGLASVQNDRMRIKELWSVFYKAWWESEDDPSIRLISFIPQMGELWDGPNRLVAVSTLIMSAITGGELSLGTNAKVAM